MKDFFVFIHIEKASGTTLHNWLKHNVPGYVSLRSWHPWTNEKKASFLSKDLKLLKTMYYPLSGIGGHTCRNYYDYEKAINQKIKFFTFVREPISRYLSHLQYQIDNKGINWSVDEFLAENRFNNFMTNRIAGSNDLNRAIDYLEKKFDFIGITDNFDESLLILNQAIFQNKLDVRYEKLNVGSRVTKMNYNNLTSSQKSKIKENNTLDIALYRHIIEKIYPKYLKEYKGDLSSDVDKLQSRLVDFSYSKSRKLKAKTFFIINNYIIQPIVRSINH